MLAEENTDTVLSEDKLPAGGNDPHRFDWQEVWYPVYYLQDLDKRKLHRMTVLERDLVIWWDAQGQQWRAFDDQCPHRLAPLSEGRIAEDGLLECPYHGWAFTGDGLCDRIPQQVPGATAQTSRRACVQSLPTAERQGLLFVYAGTPEVAHQVDIPIVPALEESSEDWVCLNTFRDLPYDALTLMENVLDASHVPFTHHRSVGNRANASPVELDVLEFGKHGFTGTWAEGPRKGKLGRQDTTFLAPHVMWHDLTSKQFGRTLTVVYATPMRKGECRLFARFPFKFSSKLPSLFLRLTPQWYSHLGQNGVLEDDQIFLHYQERYLEAKGGSPQFTKAFYLPTRADAFVTSLRKWVNEYDANPFPGRSLPPRRSIEELLDRYHSHTQHCASCRQALKTIQRSRVGLLVVAAIAWSLMLLVFVLQLQWASWLIVGLSVLPLLSSGLWFGLGRLERQFYEGRAIPPRNVPA
jgi:phenylpropionate dioxygenase-like ring-hydroxylating dioxygenase large terminal subunit